MLTYLYLFSVIVGGVLLASSLLLGGHEDADLDAGDVDLDLDLDADADGGLDKDLGAHGDLSGFLFLFLSLRYWIFFLAFFGLTGLVLDMLNLVGSQWLGLGLAVAMGTVTGLGATSLIRKLGTDTTGRVVTSKDYVGKTARVVVPFEGASYGKVRINIKGNSVDLLATGFNEEGYEGKEEVVIVEMDGPRARVARLHARNKG